MLYDLKTASGDVAGTARMADKWVKGNAGQTAFLRIRYSDELLAQLGEAIESMQLSPVDRLGVQSDAFALAKAGQLPTDRALALAVKYVNEQDFTVWSDLAGSLGDVMGTWAAEVCCPRSQRACARMGRACSHGACVCLRSAGRDVRRALTVICG